uniref:Uncharacterized protein n=1 Tax=Megaselia scalaris TaxID=36166 RepID=T1H4M7_MEGSC
MNNFDYPIPEKCDQYAQTDLEDEHLTLAEIREKMRKQEQEVVLKQKHCQKFVMNLYDCERFYYFFDDDVLKGIFGIPYAIFGLRFSPQHFWYGKLIVQLLSSWIGIPSTAFTQLNVFRARGKQLDEIVYEIPKIPNLL